MKSSINATVNELNEQKIGDVKAISIEEGRGRGRFIGCC